MDRTGGDGTGRVTGAVMTLAWVLAVALIGVVAWWAVAAVIDPGEGRAGVLSPVEVESARAAQEAAAPDPTPTDEPSPSTTPEPTTAPTAEPTQAPAGPAEVARTWDVNGGQVGVVCRGAVAELLYATPLEGWTVDLGDDDEHVDVEFSRGESETKLRAVCADGVPTASVEDETDDD